MQQQVVLFLSQQAVVLQNNYEAQHEEQTKHNVNMPRVDDDRWVR